MSTAGQGECLVDSGELAASAVLDSMHLVGAYLDEAPGVFHKRHITARLGGSHNNIRAEPIHGQGLRQLLIERLK
jgi:hypothetical protein